MEIHEQKVDIGSLTRQSLCIKRFFQKKHRELREEERINVEKGSTCSYTLVLY